MAAQNGKHELNTFFPDTAGHGDSPVCHIYALQHIFTNFQPILKNIRSGETHFGAREQRAGFMDPTSDRINALSGPNTQGLDIPGLHERKGGAEPYGLPMAGRGRGRGESPSSISDDDSTLCQSTIHDFIDAYGGNFSNHAFKSCLKLSSDDLLGDDTTATVLFHYLMQLCTKKLSWTLYVDSKPANHDVRYYYQKADGLSRGKNERGLAELVDRRAKERAKNHWICVRVILT
jgi:hypothetical protein